MTRALTSANSAAHPPDRELPLYPGVGENRPGLVYIGHHTGIGFVVGMIAGRRHIIPAWWCTGDSRASVLRSLIPVLCRGSQRSYSGRQQECSTSFFLPKKVYFGQAKGR